MYLRQGPARSVTMVAEELHKSRSLIGRWSSRHRWRARVDAWDASIVTTYRAEAHEAQRSLAHRHLAVAHVALQRVSAAVYAIDPAELTVAGLVRLWEIAVRTEREALQQPIRLEVTGADGKSTLVAALTDEERRSRLLSLRRELDERLSEASGIGWPADTDG